MSTTSTDLGIRKVFCGRREILTVKKACRRARAMKLTYLIVFFALLETTFAQSGMGVSASFTGKVELPDESFTADLEDKTSAAYISLKDLFEEELCKEIEAELNNRGVSFTSVDVSVTRFSKGSIVVNFDLVVEDTSISVSDLATVAEDVTKDLLIGSLKVDQIEDLDECEETSPVCSEFARCLNTIGSFRCECEDDKFDQSGDGTVCVTPLTVLCKANKMEISMTKAYLDSLRLSLDDMRLTDSNCGGIFDSESGNYLFTIPKDPSNCGSDSTSNATHVTYENSLRNIPKPADVILTGANVAIPFSCSYSKTVSRSLSFKGTIGLFNIIPPTGKGGFDIKLEMYTSESFTTLETKTEFETTEKLYLQAELHAEDGSLAVVLDKCWATPSDDPKLSKQYHIITNRCASPEAVEGLIEILVNGESKKSRFSVQVFTFIAESITYIHCSMVVCSTANGNTCRPSCPAASGKRKRREIHDDSIVTLHRRRRETQSAEDKTVGPLFRKDVHPIGSYLLLASSSFVLVVSFLLLIAGCFILKRRKKSDNAVIGLKMEKLEGTDNRAYS